MVSRVKAAVQLQQQKQQRRLIFSGSVLSVLIAMLWALPVLADDKRLSDASDGTADGSVQQMDCADVPVPWVPGALEIDDQHTEKRHRVPIDSPAGDTGCTTA